MLLLAIFAIIFNLESTDRNVKNLKMYQLFPSQPHVYKVVLCNAMKTEI
jgi:hypothetical protein